ncbi:hypothetical protein KY284_030330 [Solanum tuberosum]|nr:hypothetical protein KY284_030330 [Solanum tuberosum]
MAKSTVFRRIKDGTIRTHTNSIKPQLTEQNKKSERYYLLPEEHEPDPYHSCKSIFPFVVKEPAKWNSKNRTAGTLETKPILSVTKDITRACLIEKVLPAIRSKWPASDSNIPIFIQQDNARPHIGVNDLELLKLPKKMDSTLDYAPSNVDELVEAVERSFDEMKIEQLNHVFLTLQSCMIEVMKDNGGNNYKVPHLNKNRLEREDNLPLQLCCDMEHRKFQQMKTEMMFYK